MGIDPGTIVMGFGLIKITESKIQLIEMGVLRLSSKDDAYERLKKIHQRVNELILTYHPNQCAIEAPFFGKNVQSMLKLGRAQGVAIAAAMHAGLTVNEYSPKKIKQSITGNGNADKEQVMKMLQKILRFDDDPKYMDASDALAVAVCHHFQHIGIKTVQEKKMNGWKDFLKKNPGKIKN